jgi:SAM-dependent methyltransferase
VSSLKNKKDNIGSLYDASVDAYDMLYKEEQLEKYREVFRLIKGGRLNILDIGVGTGQYFCEYLNDEYYLIGIDISYLSLRRSFSRSEYLYVDLVYGDGEDPPIRLNSIDYLISITVIHHFKNPSKFLYKVLNKVRRGVFLSFFNKVFNREYVNNLASKYGCVSMPLGNDYLILCKKI